MPHPTQILPHETVLLVVDVQEKLVPKIIAAQTMIRNIAFLLDAAKLAGVESAATEQYPRGLGPTVAPLAERVPQRPDKLAFSCCAVPGLLDGFRQRGRGRVLVTGIETHVCVLNTVLDLLAADFRTYIAVDAVGSRFTIDHETALRRLERAGAILTTA
jgi:nicotinamidase-related amidase